MLFGMEAHTITTGLNHVGGDLYMFMPEEEKKSRRAGKVVIHPGSFFFSLFLSTTKPFVCITVLPPLSEHWRIFSYFCPFLLLFHWSESEGKKDECVSVTFLFSALKAHLYIHSRPPFRSTTLILHFFKSFFKIFAPLPYNCCFFLSSSHVAKSSSSLSKKKRKQNVAIIC